MMRLWRFCFARWLIHTGLNVMPPGRTKAELMEILWDWRCNLEDELRRRSLAANSGDDK